MTGVEVISHDGPARLGRFTRAGRTTWTPSACYLAGEREGTRFFDIGEGSGIRLSIPPHPGVFREGQQRAYRDLRDEYLIRSSYVPAKADGDGCLLVGGPVPPEDASSRCFALGPGGRSALAGTVAGLIELRKAISPNAAVIVLGAEVWAFPLLVLAGADILCDSHAVSCTLSGRMLFESYTLPAEGTQDPCCCPHCSGTGKPTPERLAAHNRWIVGKVLSEIRNRIRIGEIKHLAEERAVSHPDTMATLKRLYREHFEYLEEYTTVRPGADS